jgi:hypothetical protein
MLRLMRLKSCPEQNVAHPASVHAYAIEFLFLALFSPGTRTHPTRWSISFVTTCASDSQTTGTGERRAANTIDVVRLGTSSGLYKICRETEAVYWMQCTPIRARWSRWVEIDDMCVHTGDGRDGHARSL